MLTSPNKAKNSNVEWLRIISALLIIAFHATKVGYNSTDANFVVYASGQVFGSWGILGVDLFFIISAWFLVDQKFHIKRVISIVFETFTWVFAYTLLSIFYDFQQTQSIRAVI